MMRRSGLRSTTPDSSSRHGAKRVFEARGPEGFECRLVEAPRGLFHGGVRIVAEPGRGNPIRLAVQLGHVTAKRKDLEIDAGLVEHADAFFDTALLANGRVLAHALAAQPGHQLDVIWWQIVAVNVNAHLPSESHLGPF